MPKSFQNAFEIDAPPKHTTFDGKCNIFKYQYLWKYRFSLGKNNIFKDFNNMSFLLLQCNFASKNLPKRLPKRSGNDEKIKSKSTCFLTSIFLRHVLHFGRFRKPSWSQDWAKSASWEDLATNWAPLGRSWTLLQHFASILVRFGTNWERFCSILERILEGFG